MSKLVRDKIPDIIKEDEKTPIIRIADDAEYFERLQDKLKEEVEEFCQDGEEEELADILEVVEAIMQHKEWDIETLKEKKKDEIGGYEKRIILERVE